MVHVEPFPFTNQQSGTDWLMYTSFNSFSCSFVIFFLKSFQVGQTDQSHLSIQLWVSIATKILVDFLLGLEGTKMPFQLGILHEATEFHASRLKSSAGAPLLKYCRWHHRPNKYYKTCLLTLKCQPSKMGFRACFHWDTCVTSQDGQNESNFTG